jgi:hypothetical protein
MGTVGAKDIGSFKLGKTNKKWAQFLAK